MNENRHVVLTTELRRGHKRRLVVRVQRMRRHGRYDERIVLEFLDECFGALQSGGRRLGVGNRKLDDRLTEDAAKARRFRRARNLLFEVIHVGVGGRPRLNHFEGRQARPRADELRGHGLGFRGKDVLRQPFHQPHVVGQPAVQHHRRVRVGVDQPRHEQSIFQPFDLDARICANYGICLTHSPEATIRADQHRAIWNNTVILVHQNQVIGMKNDWRHYLMLHQNDKNPG